MFPNSSNYSYTTSYSSSEIKTSKGIDTKKEKIILENKNGKKKGIYQKLDNNKLSTIKLNDDNIDYVFKQEIYKNPFETFKFSKPKLNNLNQNSASFVPNDIGNNNLDLIDMTGSDIGYNYGQLSSNLNNFVKSQDLNSDPYYEDFFRFRGGNGK